jgi:hypothetical protein
VIAENFKALFQHLRLPIAAVSTPRRIAYAALVVLVAPLVFLEYVNKAAPPREAGTGTSFVEDVFKAATSREERSAGASPPSSSDT